MNAHKPATPAPFCAICADDIPPGTPPRFAALGPNDEPMTVCADCADEPAVAKRGPEIPYEPQGAATGLMPHLRAAMDKHNIHGDVREDLSPQAKDLRLGYVVVRVSSHDHLGRRREHSTALAIARKKWGPDVCTFAKTRSTPDRAGWYVFQMPTPNPDTDSACQSLDILEPYRRRKGRH